MNVGVVTGTDGARHLVLPPPRGPLSDRLFAALLDHPDQKIDRRDHDLPQDPISDHDLALALYIINELHYADIAGVDERWEWAPGLADFRAMLEDAFLIAVKELVPDPDPQELVSIGHTLRRLVLEDDGPPLSSYMAKEGTLEQMLEHVVHRSAYQLKEADPHSFVIPRLPPSAKTPLLEIQFDEYGSGRLDRMHAVLFADTMRALGLDPTYGAYIDKLPGITLATVNLMSLFGLHRRLRGAMLGHLAIFEMTSAIPNRRYGNALRRLGYTGAVTAFYDEHVEADSVHEEIAAWDLAGGLTATEPSLAPDVLFGAKALLALEREWGARLLRSWADDESSLLESVAFV
jgi:hypothetical protein